MEAKELRVGNLLNHCNDGVDEVIKIQSIGYKTDGYSGYYIAYKGGSSTLESLYEDEEDWLNTPIP